MSSSFLLTIGIPTYNNPESLHDELSCIASQLSQDSHLLSSIEVLVSDNSDNDKSGAVVASFEKCLPNLVYIKNTTNIGFDRNVDQVLTHARGTFCWTISDNDLIVDGGIASVVRVIQKYSDSAHILIRQHLVPNDHVTCFTNMETMLREGGYRTVDGGLISQNIFNTQLLPEDRARYYGNYWFHLSVAFALGAQHSVVCMPSVFVEKPVSEECRWAKDGTTFITYTSLHTIITNLAEFGYSQKMIDRYHHSFMYGMPHQVVTGKLYGLLCNKESIQRLYFATKRDPAIFLLCCILLASPTSILRLAKIIKRSWKK